MCGTNIHTHTHTLHMSHLKLGELKKIMVIDGYFHVPSPIESPEFTLGKWPEVAAVAFLTAMSESFRPWARRGTSGPGFLRV